MFMVNEESIWEKEFCRDIRGPLKNDDQYDLQIPARASNELNPPTSLHIISLRGLDSHQADLMLY
eukprot:1137502-Pelagomonas_calceolata.AAC.1